MGEGEKTFQFSFPQRMYGTLPVCSCCHTTVAARAGRLHRAGHVLHDHCAVSFDAVALARDDLAAAFKQMPAEFFGEGAFMDQLWRTCTYDGLRNLLRDLAQLLRQKKDMLRRTMKTAYADILARLRAAADRIRMGHVIANALA